MRLRTVQALWCMKIKPLFYDPAIVAAVTVVACGATAIWFLVLAR